MQAIDVTSMRYDAGSDSGTVSDMRRVRLGRRPRAARTVLRSCWPALVGASAIASAGWLLARFAAGAPGGAHDVLTALIVAAGALVSSIAGFAFGPVAGVGLVHVRPDPIDFVVLVLVCSITTQCYGLVMLRRQIAWRASRRYIVAGVPATPLGAWGLTLVSPQWCFAFLGVTVLLFSAYVMLRPAASPRLRTSIAADCACGVVAGILAGLVGFPSAAITVWCTLKDGSKDQQRAVFQPVLLSLQLAALASVACMGRGPSLHRIAEQWVFVPFAMLGAIVGVAIYRRLNTLQFGRLVHGVLIVSGVSMLARAWG